MSKGWYGEVHPPTRRLQHPFDEVAHLIGGQDRVGQLGRATSGHEDFRRLVDPDLLDRRVLQVPLQRSEPGDVIAHSPGRLTQVRQRGQPAMQRALVIVGHRVMNKLTHLPKVTRGVQSGAADQLAHFALDSAYGVHRPTPATVIRPTGMSAPKPARTPRLTSEDLRRE